MFVLSSYVERLVGRKIINECLYTVYLAVLFTYTQMLVSLKLDSKNMEIMIIWKTIFSTVVANLQNVVSLIQQYTIPAQNVSSKVN